MITEVFQFPNYLITDEGIVINKLTHKSLTPILKNTYLSIRLSNKGKVKCFSLHRLVYQSFKGKIKEGNQINHINGIRTDNKLSNLEEVTPRENIEKMLFLKKGSNVNTSKLTEKQVMEIREAKSKGENSLNLAKKYFVTKSAINRIASGKTWKYLPILPVDNSVWGNRHKTGAMTKKILEEKYGKEYFSKISKGKKFIKHCPTCTCCNI